MDHKLIPLFSISGLTLFSISGLIFLKTKDTALISPSIIQDPQVNSVPSPTQVPKSIEHYLLASQQFFTQAVDAQTQQKSPETVTNLLNRSLSFANESVKSFPNDFRSYLQRGQIYQSLINSQPQLVDGAITDYCQAQQLNPNSPEITRTLATLYAKKGDPQNTLTYLSKTVSLEPTKAQNFYDLARVQQQTGLITNAVNTYSQLLSLINDPIQKTQIEAEKAALEKLVSQNPLASPKLPSEGGPSDIPQTNTQPLLQASLPHSGLIIAAPETSQDITVKNQTNSNSLSGNSIIAPGQSQITIVNSNLKPTSEVYVSIVSGGKNQTLEVKSKTTDSFTVGLDSPSIDKITFKWWIVN